MGKTSIEWTRGDDGTQGVTWNAVRGCSRISEGCRNCYAERIAARFSRPEPVPYKNIHGETLTGERAGRFAGFAEMTPSGPRWTGKVALVPEKLGEPLRWRKPRRVFVNSMSDLFHEALSNEDIAAVFGVMAACPQHTFQILTKRAKRMREWFEWASSGEYTGAWGRCYHALHSQPGWSFPYSEEPPDWYVALPKDWPLPQVWLGVSVEDQKTADERIPELLRTPAAVRFCSYEPALVGVDFVGSEDAPKNWLYEPGCTCYEMIGGHQSMCPHGGGRKHNTLDWIIAGAESGPGARPMAEDWVRSVRDQCKAAGVAFFLKQKLDERGRKVSLPLLDGVRHAAFPEVRT